MRCPADGATKDAINVNLSGYVCTRCRWGVSKGIVLYCAGPARVYVMCTSSRGWYVEGVRPGRAGKERMSLPFGVGYYFMTPARHPRPG